MRKRTVAPEINDDGFARRARGESKIAFGLGVEGPRCRVHECAVVDLNGNLEISIADVTRLQKADRLGGRLVPENVV